MFWKIERAKTRPPRGRHTHTRGRGVVGPTPIGWPLPIPPLTNNEGGLGVRQPKRSDRAWITLRKKTISTARQNNQPCALCGQAIDYQANPMDNDAPSVDHVLPWADYPEQRLDPRNLQVTHRNCNLRKGRKTRSTKFPNIGNQSRKWGTRESHF